MDKEKYDLKDFPFFKSYHGEGKAIIDISAFEKWYRENKEVELMSEADEADREQAYKELDEGKALGLEEAMEEW